MQQSLADLWQCRCALWPIQASVALSAHGLTIGAGTILLPFSQRLERPMTLEIGAGHDRMVALLAVAGQGRIDPIAIAHIDLALADWRRGDKALAGIRLAFASLPRLADEGEAYALFLAETALDAGLPPGELLAELGYGDAGAILKGAADQPRVPAGSGRASGQWTSGGPDAQAPTSGGTRTNAKERHDDLSPSLFLYSSRRSTATRASRTPSKRRPERSLFPKP